MQIAGSPLPAIFKYTLLLLLIWGVQPAMAQLKRGERLMNEGRYDDASQAFRKDFYGKKPDPKAGYLLAQCYYKLHDYAEARDVIELLENEFSSSVEMSLFYADVLIVNDAFSEAYLHVVQMLAKDQNDPIVYLWYQKVSDLLRWDTVSTKSSVRPITGINTVYNEYAPLAGENGTLWYVTDVNAMQSIFPASYSGQNIHLLYKTRYDTARHEIVKPSMVVKNRKYYDHDGPLAAWPGRGLHAVTMRDIDAPVETSRLGIYFIDLNKGADPVPFKYNQSYHTGHPSFSDDGSRMYFSSDRPGGIGQMDIWYCEWENEQWSLPVNMGTVVNSPANEVFPRMYDARLYFASDRRDKGYGGLDLYFSSEILNFRSVQNMRSPINGPYDDFGLSMSDYHAGFIASNRPEGAGGDDVYSMIFYPSQIIHEERMARFVGRSIDMGTKVEVRDGMGRMAKETYVGNDNEVSLAGLKTNEHYRVKILDGSNESLQLTILDDNGDVAQLFVSSNESIFSIELLDPENYAMGRLAAEDPALYYQLNGQVVGGDENSYASSKVVIQSASGETVGTAQVSQNGNFTFDKLVTGTGYVLKTEGIKGKHEMDILGKSGAPVESIRSTGNNSFSYTRAMPSADWMLSREVEVADVVAVIVSESNVANISISLREFEVEASTTLTTDEDGFAELGTLHSYRAYEMVMPSATLTPDDRLVLLDGNGDTSQTVRPYGNNAFRFEYLLYDSYTTPAMVTKAPLRPSAPGTGSYRGSITPFRSGDNTPMLLTSAAGALDTVYVSADGTFVLNNISKGEPYQLRLMKGSLHPEANLEVKDDKGKSLLNTRQENRNAFSIAIRGERTSGIEEVLVDQSVPSMPFSGRAVGGETGDRMAMKVISAEGALLSEGFSTRDGSFFFQDIPKGERYAVEFEDHTPDNLYLNLPTGTGIIEAKADGSGGKRFTVDFNDPPVDQAQLAVKPEMEVRREFTVPHVYYNFNSYYLKEESRKSLDMLTRYLKQNPVLEIEIRSYTDSRGSDDYNLLLSERRAQSVVEYLTAKGIDKRRLTTQGFGEKSPVNHCVDGVNCSEEEHALNRRTTFVILID